MKQKNIAAGLCFLMCLGIMVPAVSPGGQIKVGSQFVPEEKIADAAIPVGAEIPSFSFKDMDGKSHYLDQLVQNGPAVFVFLSTVCPEANRYSLRLSGLYKEFAGKGISLFGVYSNEETTKSDIANHVKDMKFSFPVVKDFHAYVARKLGATMTPQAFVIDQNRKLRYRGAIDDNRYENLVKQHYLRDAVTAVLNDRPVAVTQSDTRGCTIHFPVAATAGNVTYTEHIARIVQDNCVVCHRPGQVGPFSLTSYKKVRAFAHEIKAHTEARIMPPWKPVSGFGEFKNNRRLSDDEIAMIAKWVEQGRPEGDKEALPPPPQFPENWILGEPDMIVEMPEEYVLGGEGQDDYRHFIVPTDLPEDVYVRAIDVRPGNRKIVHHVIAYVDNTGKARKLDKKDPGPGYTNFGGPGFKAVSSLGGWAPGTMPEFTPKGTGYLLPKGADVVLQVHYYRSGKTEKDRTKVGLYFSKTPRTVRIHTGAAINTKFTIPPGSKRYQVEANWKIKHDVYAFSVYPHMHLLGKEMKVTAHLPNGKVLPMVWIDNWDFNWQTGYLFKEPLMLPKGTVVRAVAYFDNSPGNPFNPNHPPIAVGWGERTTDEMCIAFVDVVSAPAYQQMRKHLK